MTAPVRKPSGAAAIFAAREYGGFLTTTESNPTVGITAAPVIGGNPDRVLLLIINLSANNVYLSFLPNVSSSNGIFIGANGGSAQLNVKDDGILSSRQIHAIASVAGSQLYVLEMYRLREIKEGDL